MSETPAKVTGTRLWARLALNSDLAGAIRDIRDVAEELGAQAAHTVPGFTDHSVEHMDALWAVTDVVLTGDETDMMSPAEAFILGASFYVHDLGMALAATSEGLKAVRESGAYEGAKAKASAVDGLPEGDADRAAIQVASRALHAEKALQLATAQLPGVGRHLLEKSELRDDWAWQIGTVSSSHHWSLSQVNRDLGSSGRIPAADGGLVDLGYVACILRVVDYAHINSDRAAYLDRVLRSEISDASLVHWKAQEHVKGPSRESGLLVYATTKPIDDVEAWWLYYSVMACGADKEIHDVREYLTARSASDGRFSLEGVKAVSSPQAFAALVQPAGFEPVDIRFHSGSIDRLVNLLV